MDHDTHHSAPSKLPHQLYMNIPEFTLESGITLTNLRVAFTFHGLLNDRGDNAVLICHSLSGNADVEEWWPSLMNDANPTIRPDEYCIICCNSLGSPYGSSSPLTYRGGDRRKSTECYGPAFPKTTIRDDVRAHKYVLDVLGVKSIQCVIGMSMGGMHALEWSFYGDHYALALVLIATAARQGAWQIAWSETQRNTIQCDAKYRSGWYGDDPPQAGLAAGRMAALLTYRSHHSFEKRFGRAEVMPTSVDSSRLITSREPSPSSSLSSGPSSGPSSISSSLSSRSSSTSQGTPDTEICDDSSETTPIFSVQNYLRRHGDKFNDKFDANCYLHILDKMDSHDITRDRCPSNVSEDAAVRRILSRIKQPTLVVGIPSDGLYPIDEQLLLLESMPHAFFGVIESHDGHDSFLTEAGQLDHLVRNFFDKLRIIETDVRGKRDRIQLYK